jgi:hypothetical protein
MSLPSKAIERLFERLTATYGREWVNRWEGIDLAAIKTVWAHELSVYANHLEDIAWALENLPARAPNVIEFKQLCRSAPRQDVQALPAPPADPERVKAEMAKLHDVLKAKPTSRHDPKAWAKTILARDAAGDKLSAISVRFAKEALGVRP